MQIFDLHASKALAGGLFFHAIVYIEHKHLSKRVELSLRFVVAAFWDSCAKEISREFSSISNPFNIFLFTLLLLLSRFFYFFFSFIFVFFFRISVILYFILLFFLRSSSCFFIFLFFHSCFPS